MPQLEDGYIRIATELWEALTKIRISGEARQVFDAIIRKTYGWRKKQDVISLSQLEKMTGLKHVHIIRARNKLIKMNLIVTQKGNTGNVSYYIQKNYHKWKPLPKKVTLPKKVINITKKGNRGVPKKVDTKDTITKDTITKDKTLVDKSTKKKIKKPTNPNIRLFIDGFYNSFKEKTGAPYLVSGKDGSLVKRLLGTYSLSGLSLLKDRFFSIEDPFIEKAGYTIGVFSSQINKIISGKSGRYAGIQEWVKEMEEKVKKESKDGK